MQRIDGAIAEIPEQCMRLGRPQGYAPTIRQCAFYGRGDPCGRPALPGRIRCCALIVLVLCSSLIFTPFISTASAHSQYAQHSQGVQSTKQTVRILVGNGRITGQLQDGTNKNAPLAGQKVTLQVAQGTNASDLTTTTTDGHGIYTFNNLSTDKTLSYVVYILYQGAQYTSNVVTLDTKPSQTVNLTVYEATSSTAKLVVLQATLLVRPPDVQHGVLTISEIFFFRNLDSRTFVGTFNTSGGQHKPNALRFSLPGNAKAITLGTGFAGYQTAQVDLGFATNAAIPPGESQFSFSFQLPYNAATYDLSYTVVYPTIQLSFLVPTDIHANSGFLTSGGVITTEQHPYQMFQGSQLRTDDQVHVQLQGLPLPTNSSKSTPLNATTIWLIVAVLLLLAITTTVWYLRSSQRSRSQRRTASGRGKTQSARSEARSAKSKTAKTSGADDAGSKDSKNSKNKVDTAAKPSSASEQKREVLLQELLALDTSFEAGKLSKSAYQERRAKTKARLRAIMREQGEQEASRR